MTCTRSAVGQTPPPGAPLARRGGSIRGQHQISRSTVVTRGGGGRREPWINRGGRGLSPPSEDRHRVPGRAPSDASSLSGGESSRGLKGNQKIYLCPSSPVSLAVSLDTSVPQKPKKKKSASRACEQTKEKGKNLVRRKCKLNIFFFSSGKKKALPSSQRGTKSKFCKIAPF